MDELVRSGQVVAHPVVYEDFLPVSAAGIFQSNLGDGGPSHLSAGAMQAEFEQALGAPVADPFQLYAAIEAESIQRSRKAISGGGA